MNTWNQTGYGYQTVALAAQQEEGDGDYCAPCPVCGGIGYTGQNLTVPCRTCGTRGEVYAPPAPPRPEEPHVPYDAARDPWAVPGVEAGPPPF